VVTCGGLSRAFAAVASLLIEHARRLTGGKGVNRDAVCFVRYYSIVNITEM
jgi:hypothetical protein